VTCVPTYSDFGADVDNVPNNMMEFKHLDGWDCGMSFSSIKFNAANIAWSLGAADTANATTPTGAKKITPRRDLVQTDFKDIFAAFPMADGGIFVVELKNAVSTGGLNIQTTKNGKGTSQVTLTGYVSIDAQDEMPMAFYHIPKQTTGTGTGTGTTP
jgi:hypothetical protein